MRLARRQRNWEVSRSTATVVAMTVVMDGIDGGWGHDRNHDSSRAAPSHRWGSQRGDAGSRIRTNWRSEPAARVAARPTTIARAMLLTSVRTIMEVGGDCRTTAAQVASDGEEECRAHCHHR